jgi:acyl-CoA dehydrogenase
MNEPMAIDQAEAVNAPKLRFGIVAAKTDSLKADLTVRTKVVTAAAAAHAGEVDEQGLFPEEAIAAARIQRLLGILVPREFGGEGAGITDAAEVCYGLGRVCSSTAMIYAMHQSNVACLVRHAGKTAWDSHVLRRLGTDQILLASSTTEGRRGANIRSSDAALKWNGKRIRFERQASVVSYGARADGILTLARRTAEAAGSDQVLVLFLRDDYSLEQVAGWDALGMRGTCSAGFHLRAEGGCDQVLPEAYAKIHLRTMMPVSHLMWASVWAGIAAGAVERARLFVRSSARRAEGQLPPGATHFARATASLQTLRGLVTTSLAQYEKAAHDEAALESFDFQTSMNLLKVSASELAIATVMSAFQACGLAGYRNDGEFSIGRSLRDVLSSSIMINNDRILSNSITPSLLNGVPEQLHI